MTTINEQSALFVSLALTDEDDLPLTPTTLEWRLDDLTNDAEVVGWQTLTPASDVDFTISAQNNTITDDSVKRQRMEITVRLNDGLATEATEIKRYWIRNLSAVT